MSEKIQDTNVRITFKTVFFAVFLNAKEPRKYLSILAVEIPLNFGMLSVGDSISLEHLKAKHDMEG